MSDVVLRCPNCGTTQGESGECEACHESEVRYFCTSHTPGRWLDGPACPDCGARFGVAAPAAPRAPTPRAPTPRAAATPPPRRMPRPSPPVDPPSGAWADDPPPPRPARTTLPPMRGRVPATLDGWLRSLPIPARTPRAPAPPAAGPRTRLPVVGCLVRLVITLVLLALLAVGAIIALFGGVGSVQRWVVDVGQSTGVLEGVPEQTARGIAAFEAGDRATAERELRSAARLYPRSALALLYLARISDDAGQPARAVEYLRTSAAREPGSAAVQREFGAHHLTAARRADAAGAGGDVVGAELAEAERRYTLALQVDPRDAVALGGYGCAVALAGRADEAAAAVASAGPGAWDACLREPPIAP